LTAQWVSRLEGPATILVVVVASFGVTFGASSLASAGTFIKTIGVETGSLLVADYGVDPADTEFAPLAPEIIESAASDRGVTQSVLPAAERAPAPTIRPVPAAASARDEAPRRPPVAPPRSVEASTPPLAIPARPPTSAGTDSDSLASLVEPPPAATERPTAVPTPTPKPGSNGSGGVVTPVLSYTGDALGDTVDATLPGLRFGDTLDELTQPLDPVTGLVDDTLEPVTDLLEPTVDELPDPVEDLAEPLDPLLEDVVGGLIGGLFG